MKNFIKLNREENKLVVGGTRTECFTVCEEDTVCVISNNKQEVLGDSPMIIFIKVAGVFVASATAGFLIGICTAKIKNKLHKD